MTKVHGPMINLLLLKCAHVQSQKMLEEKIISLNLKFKFAVISEYIRKLFFFFKLHTYFSFTTEYSKNTLNLLEATVENNFLL